MKYDDEEIFEKILNEENERFVGKEKDERNEKRFLELINLAKRIKQASDETMIVSYTDLEQRGRNALVWIDMDNPTFFDTFKLRNHLSSMILAADDVVIASGDEEPSLRISFGIRDVWMA